MAEVLLQFDTAVAGADGNAYVARICGRPADDGLWEGWIEFDPRDGTPTLRTPRETGQPNREDLEYWATGLTVAYLEGALERARHHALPDLRPRAVVARQAYDGPAPAPEAAASAGATRHTLPHAIIDPFAVYGQGEDLLRSELGALDEGHLRNVIREHRLIDESDVDLQALGRDALAELIVAAVRRRAG
jgi:hypothetical protein